MVPLVANAHRLTHDVVLQTSLALALSRLYYARLGRRTYSCPRKSASNYPQTIKKSLHKGGLFNGAASKNRTYDPTLTKGVLYH